MMFYISVLFILIWVKNQETVYQQNNEVSYHATSYSIILYLGNTNNEYNILIKHILNLKILSLINGIKLLFY